MKDNTQTKTDDVQPLATEKIEFAGIGRNRDRDRERDRECDGCGKHHDNEEILTEEFQF